MRRTTETTVERLRKELESGRGAGSGRPYPEALRRDVIAYVRERVAIGASLTGVAAELGLSVTTLVRWGASTTSFVPVQVVDAPTAATAIVVHGPAGIRVEGLSIEELAQLLRRLS